MKTLVTVANYAKKIGKTTTWVYKLIEKGEIECEKIDGIKFIRVSNGKS